MRRSSAISLAGALLAIAMQCLATVLVEQRARAQPATDAAANVPLLERSPFDRITLNAANKNVALEVQLLDFPDRRLPAPLPETGSLDVRLIDQPSVDYSLDWSAVERIELFEQLLLLEANRLTEAREFAEAFQYFSFLQRYYPNLPGLEDALQNHLWRDAIDSFNRNDPDGALPALSSLYKRNPSFPRMTNAIRSVSESLLADRLQEGDIAGARHVVDVVESAFPKLELPQVAEWRNRFRTDAQQQLQLARKALDAQQYKQARQAVQQALAILPEVSGAQELLLEIHRAAPEIRVAVYSTGTTVGDGPALDPQAARLSRLLLPRLFEQIGFGAEGGIYRSDWVEQSGSDDGLETTLLFKPGALQRGLLPERFALALLEAADADRVETASLAAVLEQVDLLGGDAVQLRWRRPHVRPEALLQTPLARFTSNDHAVGTWTASANDSGRAVRFAHAAREMATNEASGLPLETSILEEIFDDDEAAVQALLNGDVDVVESVPPWQLSRLRGQREIQLGRYRMPTVDVLLPNPKNPLLEIREFRRAICYGIDREGILHDLILAGEPQPGFHVLSGPLPAGDSLNDPVGYAYATDIAARPYEPRLAMVLARTAYATLQKRLQAAEADSTEDSSADTPPGDKQSAGDQPPLKPLVLAHPNDPLARLACRAIKIQLGQVGIPIELVELAGAQPEARQHYDLLYAELTPTEPLIDVGRILGTDGIAPHTSAIMNLRIEALHRAASWNDVRDRAADVHQIAHDELYLIPLWQTVRHFAYRDWLEGVGEEPVTLYDDVDQWRKSFGEAP